MLRLGFVITNQIVGVDRTHSWLLIAQFAQIGCRPSRSKIDQSISKAECASPTLDLESQARRTDHRISDRVSHKARSILTKLQLLACAFMKVNMH